MIDLGCGTGHMLSRHQHRFHKSIGVDHSQEMLDQAQAKPELSSEKITFIHSDIESFLNTYIGPQPDFVTVVGFLHHLEKHELTLILKRISNFLVSGGQILIAEPVMSSEVPKLINWINGKSILHERLSRAMPAHTEDPDEEPLNEDYLFKSIDEAGFERKLTTKGYDILHLNHPAKFWERLFLRFVSLIYGGGAEWRCCRNTS